MADHDVNHGRRRFLTATTAVVGGVGGVFAAVPFFKSLLPSDRAKTAGAPVVADISKIEPGQKLSISWRGQRLLPDVSESVGEKAGWITPRLGGVGVTTVAMLLQNTVQLAELQTQA